MNQRVFLGLNAIINLKQILKQYNPKNIFLVTGKYSFKKQSIFPLIRDLIKPYQITHFVDFGANPEIKDILNGVVKYQENMCDFVLSIGGGSAMDTAKAINILSYNKKTPSIYSNNPNLISHKGVPMIAIPTTAGTGSEATQYSVIFDKKTKCTLNHEYLLPDYAIIDPQLTLTLSPYNTACTGIDALTQAIESHWCTDASGETKKLSRKAIKLIMNSLNDAVNHPTIRARVQMAEAAFLAGKAINITKTTACHGIAPPITSFYGVPHGHAVGLTLAPMLLFNSHVTSKDNQDIRGYDYVKDTIFELANLIGSNSVDGAFQIIQALLQDIGLSTRLSGVGINTDADIEKIIKHCFNPKRFNNNPRLLTKEALRRQILNKIK